MFNLFLKLPSLPLALQSFTLDRQLYGQVYRPAEYGQFFVKLAVVTQVASYQLSGHW
jgi:hypothetical protein